MTWTDELKTELARLWAETEPQLSASQIGARMDLSRNSVLGRVHRMGLPSRPSPFDRDNRAPLHNAERDSRMAARFERLRSYAAVGREFGVTPTTVFKALKAHWSRLGVTPLKATRQPNRLGRVLSRKTARIATSSASHAVVRTVTVPALPEPSVAARTAYPARPGFMGRTCQWPIGDPKEDGFHFCGGPAEAARPYCWNHCQVAYRRAA